MPVYQPRKASRSAFIPIRDHRYHVREWGKARAAMPGAGQGSAPEPEPSHTHALHPSRPLLVLLHGWMDVSASFQFLVDALVQDWDIIAPDWRGYGLTQGPTVDSYWMPDYLADLDALLEYYSPAAPVHLVGHSMGGNMATLYAGARPERVRTLTSLDAIGMRGETPDHAPTRTALWLKQLREPPRMNHYASRDAVIERLCRTNPRLPPDKADYLASHWSRPCADGSHELLAAAAHKVINPYIYRVEEVLATWQRISAPVLWVLARQSHIYEKLKNVPGFSERQHSIKNLRSVWIEEASHMLHHDQPQQVARVVEEFIRG